jgi:L-amino acid N-acyltransferase
MQFIHCTLHAQGAAILAIYNDIIVNSTALYDYQQRTMDDMQLWFQEKEASNFPVLGAMGQDQLLGFATYGTWRARPAYKYSIEHSLYVHRDHRGKGVGTALLKQLIAAAQAQDYHVMIGGIDADNIASIALHKKFSFVHADTVTQAGFKF